MFAPWYDAQKLTSHSWLRDLHRHPETGFEKVRTAAFVADRLGAFGYEVETGIGGTGVVGTLHGTGTSEEYPGRCIAFRAELDTLPMQEKADADYAPHHPKFIFDPDIIPVGAAIFADLAKHRTSKSLNSNQLT